MGTAVNSEIIEQTFLDYGALRRPGIHPELEAVRTAILIEDLFEVTLSDAEIDPAVLADASVVAALAARLRGTA